MPPTTKIPVFATVSSSMQEEDLERTKKFGSEKVCLGSSFAEHKKAHITSAHPNQIQWSLPIQRIRNQSIMLSLPFNQSANHAILTYQPTPSDSGLFVGSSKDSARERNGISLPDCETDWSNRDESRCRNPLKKKNDRVCLWWSSCGRSDCSCLNHESRMPLGHGLTRP
ncbi:hypothetical protein YC2023_100748 [Brassica napus]